MYGLLHQAFTLHELANLRGTEVGKPRPVLEQESWICWEVKLYRLLHFKSVTILTNVTNIFRVWNVMKVNYKLWKITNCKYFVKTPFLFLVPEYHLSWNPAWNQGGDGHRTGHVPTIHFPPACDLLHEGSNNYNWVTKTKPPRCWEKCNHWYFFFIIKIWSTSYPYRNSIHILQIFFRSLTVYSRINDHFITSFVKRESFYNPSDS